MVKKFQKRNEFECQENLTLFLTVTLSFWVSHLPSLFYNVLICIEYQQMIDNG